MDLPTSPSSLHIESFMSLYDDNMGGGFDAIVARLPNADVVPEQDLPNAKHFSTSEEQIPSLPKFSTMILKEKEPSRSLSRQRKESSEKQEMTEFKSPKNQEQRNDQKLKETKEKKQIGDEKIESEEDRRLRIQKETNDNLLFFFCAVYFV